MSSFFAEAATAGYGEPYHMQIDEPTKHTPQADLDIKYAMELLNYLDGLKNSADCSGDQRAFTTRQVQEVIPSEFDHSCGSSESDDSLLSGYPIVGPSSLGSASQTASAIHQSDRMTPLMIGCPRQSFGFEDVSYALDQSVYNMHSAKEMVHPKPRLGHDVFAEQSIDGTDHIAYNFHPTRGTFQVKYKHAGGTSAQQGNRSSVSMSAANNQELLQELPVPPMLQKHAPASKDLWMPTAGKRESQKQVLLVCMESMSMTHMETMEEIAEEFRHEKYFYFRTAVKFTRWLFEQHRGLVSPWSVLVVGWREAKPCMTALEAAFSGDMSRVRPDRRRAVLKKPSVSVGSSRSAWEQRPMKIAVATIVVLLDSPSQQDRVQAWLNAVEGNIPNLDICIVRSLAELCQKFGAASMGQQQVVGSPGGGIYPQPPAGQELQYSRLSL